MQVYLVGGAVRDELLGRPVHERDWVVVGASPAELESLGYRAVGREFPVFLHPQTHEEYALARTERKTGPGYRGFVTQASPDVTLEQDLQRRDLTINAMARNADGAIIDPYGGERDLQQRWLRHVSPAFIEDPVRILRVARFAARFAALGFRVEPATLELMCNMVQQGEVDALVPERVWRETERALGEERPDVYFDVLQQCGALPRCLPGLVWNNVARQQLQRAVASTDPNLVRFAALLLETPADAADALCERLRVPSEYRDLVSLTQRLQPQLQSAATLTAEEWLKLLETADALRRPQRWQHLLQASAPADDAADTLHAVLQALTDVQLPREQAQTLKGQDYAAALRAARLQALQRVHSERRKS